MRSTRSAAVLLLAAFLLGTLVGAGGHLLADRTEGRDRGPRDRGRGGYLDRLTRDLALTEAQRESVRVVLERHRPAMDSLRREVAPRFETLQQTIRSDIRTQLTPEQQRKLDEMTSRLDKRKHTGGPDAPR